MIPEYQKRIEDRKVIKKETRATMILSFSLIFFTAVLGVVAYLLNVKQVLSDDAQETLYGIVNVFVVLIFILILGMRRSIYYSPKLIKENFTLSQVLQKWRKIDIILLAVAELIPLTGLVLTLMGMPFDKTGHFFYGTVILMFLLAPMEIKVKSKIIILRQHFPEI